MSRHSVLFALLLFALLSHFFRTDVASHCWHSHIWHSHSCLIRTVDPFALLAFALLASHWCRSHFCLSHSCRTSHALSHKHRQQVCQVWWGGLQVDHHCGSEKKLCHCSSFFTSFRTKKNKKKLRPKMAKIASRGEILPSSWITFLAFLHFVYTGPPPLSLSKECLYTSNILLF